VLTTWVTFIPCFLWIFLGAPFIEALRDNRALTGALSAITAAVVGVIMNLAVWFALHVLFGQLIDWKGYGIAAIVPIWATIRVPAALLTVVAMFAIFRLGVNMIPLLLVSSLAGAVWYLAGGNI